MACSSGSSASTRSKTRSGRSQFKSYSGSRAPPSGNVGRSLVGKIPVFATDASTLFIGSLPSECVGFHELVILVELRLEENERRETPDHVRDFASFFRREIAAEKLPLAIGEPLLDDLVPANDVVPDSGWHVLPEGDVIQENVAGLSAEEFRCRTQRGKLFFREIALEHFSLALITAPPFPAWPHPAVMARSRLSSSCPREHAR